MTIHFVCVGNTYRSRLAEAYLNSKHLPNINGISSGIFASEDELGPTSRFTQMLLAKYNLESKPTWTQTTKLLLDSADLTIFFHISMYEYCASTFNFHSDNIEIWDIHDLNTHNSEEEKNKECEHTFNEIIEKIDRLIPTLYDKR